ncbi:MAG: hypothetical protein KDB33_14340, partial [Acidimicrobiales bacterium]|nr:hypothetical protein [Acidimicrobiales bacterium]
YVAGATTAPDGTWTIHLTPGTYKLWFNDPTGDHLAEWHLDKPGFATATPITHTATQTITTALTPTGSVSPAP